LRVVYSDESGTGDAKKQPITVVTAIMLNMDSQWKPIERELSAIKIHRIPVGLMRFGEGDRRMSTLTQNPELKGDLLFKGLRGKIRRIEPQKAVEALTQVLSVVVKNGIQIFHGAIDRAGHAQWFASFPELVKELTDEAEALMECLQQLDKFAHANMPQESVLWIADKSGFEKSVKRGLKFVQWIRGMNSNAIRSLLLSGIARRKGEGEAEFKLLPQYDDSDTWPFPVIDTIYFGNSHESLALQLADVCCATITQHLLSKDDAKPFYDLIRGQVVTDGNLVVYSNAWQEKALLKHSDAWKEAIKPKS
jgi:hypothetical protein